MPRMSRNLALCSGVRRRGSLHWCKFRASLVRTPVLGSGSPMCLLDFTASHRQDEEDMVKVMSKAVLFSVHTQPSFQHLQ